MDICSTGTHAIRSANRHVNHVKPKLTFAPLVMMDILLVELNVLNVVMAVKYANLIIGKENQSVSVVMIVVVVNAAAKFGTLSKDHKNIK